MPTAVQLTHVGFAYRTAHELLATTPTFRSLCRAGLSPRQTRTWLKAKSSGANVHDLTHGGFTRYQATLLLAILAG